MCEHIGKLAEIGIIEERINTPFKEGKDNKVQRIILGVKLGKSGRLYVPVNYKYIEVKFCPVCGDKVKDGD